MIVANCNGADLLRACLESLRGEWGIGDLEVIVVDDGSTDGSVQLVQNLTDDLGARCHLLALKHGGLAAARNAGAAAAQGIWLLFIDNDVVIPPGFCRRAFDVLESGVADLLGCADLPRPEDGYISRSLRYLELASRGLVERRHAVKGAALFVRRDVFDEIGGFEPWRTYYEHEDTRFVEQARRAGYRISYDRTLAVFHRAPTLREYLHKWRLLLRSSEIGGGWEYHRVPHSVGVVGMAAGVLALAVARTRSVVPLTGLITVAGTVTAVAAAARAGARPVYVPGILAAGTLRLLLMPVGSAMFLWHLLGGHRRSTSYSQDSRASGEPASVPVADVVDEVLSGPD